MPTTSDSIADASELFHRVAARDETGEGMSESQLRDAVAVREFLVEALTTLFG